MTHRQRRQTRAERSPAWCSGDDSDPELSAAQILCFLSLDQSAGTQDLEEEETLKAPPHLWNVLGPVIAWP